MYKRNKKTNLKTNLTNSYIWDSNLLHVGNFNSGGRVHSALTFRLTEKPVYYEPARLCTNTTSEDNFSENIEENYKKLLIQIINIIKKIDLYQGQIHSPDKQFIELLEKYYEMCSSLEKRNRQYLSFSLSLLGQRTHFIDEKKAMKYNLLSFIFGNENLVGFERYLNYAFNTSKSFSIMDFLKNHHQFETYQEKILLSKTGYLDISTKEIDHNNETILSW